MKYLWTNNSCSIILTCMLMLLTFLHRTHMGCYWWDVWTFSSYSDSSTYYRDVLLGPETNKTTVMYASQWNTFILTGLLFDGSVGFLLEGGRVAFPLEGGVWSLPVNLFKLSNRSGGIKSFTTPLVLAISFCLPSMYGRRQPLVVVWPCLVDATTLSAVVVELILAHRIIQHMIAK